MKLWRNDYEENSICGSGIADGGKRSGGRADPLQQLETLGTWQTLVTELAITGFAHLRGIVGGSNRKQEKGTVLWHRPTSQRRAVPAAFLKGLQSGSGITGTISG